MKAGAGRGEGNGVAVGDRSYYGSGNGEGDGFARWSALPRGRWQRLGMITTIEEFKGRVPEYRRDGGILEFVRDCLVVRSPETGDLGPLELDPLQAADLAEATRRDPATGRFVYKTVVFSWPKREGKSLLAGIIGVWKDTCWSDQRSVVLANSERQAASVLYDQHIRPLFAWSPVLRKVVRADDIEKKVLRIPSMRNAIECMPCNPDTVQGGAVNNLLCDELHAAQKPLAYYMLAAQTEAADAQIVVATQAGAPVNGNPVWLLYKAARACGGLREWRDNGDGTFRLLEGEAISQSAAGAIQERARGGQLAFDDEGPEVEQEILAAQRGAGSGLVFFSYRQHHVMPWAVRLAEEDRAKVPPAEWRYMHLNAWAGQGNKLFTAEAVQAAAMGYEEPQTAADWDALQAAWGWTDGAVSLGVGLDRAGVSAEGDRTVWTVTARYVPDDGRPHQYRVVMVCVMLTGEEGEVLAAWRRTLEIFGEPDGILFEQYGCSDIVAKVDGAQLAAPTTQRQQQLFNRFWRAVGEGRYGFPEEAGWDHAEQRGGLLKGELIEFEHVCERGEGSTRYGTQSGHDDTVYSGAWSLEAVGMAPVMAASSGSGVAWAGKGRTYGARAR
jgi:hypothetical protein